MGTFQWAILAVVWLITLVPGTAAISRGWIPAWLRGSVLFPRMWGSGDVALGLGITIGMIASHGHSGASTGGVIAGLCIVLCGLGLMARAQRPGRVSHS